MQACCTCHVILEQSHFDRLSKPEEEELDMLDLAPELSDQSRLGCQVILTKEDKPSIVVKVPSITRDARTVWKETGFIWFIFSTCFVMII